ncbi:galactose-specific lectin nattectin-like [Chanos chanos]|uniref:Galactose-specific lectin nattectin-like n=1 Tax=Chanos chanos TaxID=29144 RepID=A0A6J2VQ11_CHACN|nr:galactose-specific lectin nattectin-like [Chanos chanos]
MGKLSAFAVVCLLFAFSFAAEEIDDEENSIEDLPPVEDTTDHENSTALTSAGKIIQKRATRCPSGWLQYGRRCYLFRTSPTYWYHAERYCIRYGGNLVSIHNYRERNFVVKLLDQKKAHVCGAWIGAYDAVQEGYWFWSDGSRWNYNGWQRGGIDNRGQREHCAVADSRGISILSHDTKFTLLV